jgi:hypothetical protein
MTMAHRHKIVSTVLLLVGVGLVFAGMSSAFHFSLPGIIAALAAIGGLLYAGGVWFANIVPDEPSVVLFDRHLIIVSGAHPGRPVGDLFPLSVRRDVEQRCREAFDGRSTRFSIPGHAERRRFEVAPIRTADGLVAYGILLSGEMVSMISPEQLTPVA